MAMGIDEGRRANYSGQATFTAPACYLQESQYENPAPVHGTPDRCSYRGLHCTTPISANRCHWWWSYLYNYGHRLSRELQTFWNTVLTQDKDMLEAIQLTIDRTQRRDHAPELLVAMDRGPWGGSSNPQENARSGVAVISKSQRGRTTEESAGHPL